MEFPITRVRLTGGVPEHDQKRVRKLCRSRNDPMACEMVDLGYNFPVPEHAANGTRY